MAITLILNWLKTVGNDELTIIDATFIHETDLAYLIKVTDDEEWIPKSLCFDAEIDHGDGTISFDMKQWQAEERGWI